MKEFVLISGAIYGGLAVIFGAFGAHALKKLMSDEVLKSFETGVKYQMYHALVLLFTGSFFDFNSSTEIIAGYCFILGIFLFSFSIYGLCLSASKEKKLKFLGPLTPLGGLLLVLGWGLLVGIFLTNS